MSDIEVLTGQTSHPRIAARRLEGPVKVADQHHADGLLAWANARLAARITSGVGTMWCAYAFALLALVSLPAAVMSGSAIVIVAWIAQTFLQLVLLPVIMVGQALSARAADKRAEQTYDDAEAIFHGQQAHTLELQAIRALLLAETTERP